MKINLFWRLSPCVPFIFAIACCLFAPAPAHSDSQPPQAASAAPVSDISADADYRIHDSDELDFSVLGHDELKATVTVLPDGNCAFPGAGTVRAAGLTETDLTSLLEKNLSTTINGPTVTLIVHPNISAIKVSVVGGGIKTPGQYPVERDTRLIDVIALAGGLSEDVGNTDITVYNPGGATSHRIDVPLLMSTSDLSQNIPVGPGDVIIVSATDPRWLAIQVAGEVGHAGAYEVPKAGVLLPAALAMAGGPLPTAALAKAQILHEGQVRTIDLSRIVLNLDDAAAQVRLMPGDVLQVPANMDRYAVLGSVKNSGLLEVVEGSRVTVSKAITDAGGTTDSADLMKASILREDSTGKTVSTTFDLGKVLAGKEPDIPVEPHDIIFVPAKSTSANAMNPGSWLGGLGGVAALLNFLK